jgi:pilus assembly protein FimV
MGETTLNEARISKLKALSAGVLLAWSLPSQALTLGKFQVQSAMGEPLRAEVEVTQFTPDELRGLQAQLAAPRSFQQAGMEFNPALNGVTARIENRGDGRPYIVLDGRSPIQDSFIDLILEAEWPTGRIVKNYALLLNAASPNASRQQALTTRSQVPSDVITSPITLSRAPAPTTGAQVSSIPTSVEVNADQVPVYRFDTPEPSTDSGLNRPATLSVAPAPIVQNTQPFAGVSPVSNYAPRNEAFFAGGDSLTVRPGDTASQLIMGRLPANVSSDQMLLALVRANPNAFIEGNVNLVRAGMVLRMPKPGEATQISRAEARQTVMAQHRDFAAYARRVAESPLLVGSSESREMSGRVSKEAPSSPAANANKDKLTLSKAQMGNNNAEAKLAAEREAKDAADQLSALNKNMQDLEALAKDRKTDSAVAVASNLPDATSNDPSWLDQLSQNKSTWFWAIGALFALLVLVFWSRNKSAKTNEVFAPSYDDGPSQPMPPMGSSMNVPPQMAGIDLNLNSSPAPSAAPSANEVTQQNKLALASQLLATGDTDLARTLIMSVASTASGDLKARALQMLGQIA